MSLLFRCSWKRLCCAFNKCVKLLFGIRIPLRLGQITQEFFSSLSFLIWLHEFIINPKIGYSNRVRAKIATVLGVVKSCVYSSFSVLVGLRRVELLSDVS